LKTNARLFVVTGAGNGIGRALVLELLKRGAKVAAVDISEEALAETTRLAASTDLSTHVVDISKRDQVEALPSKVLQRHGAIDGLINCAGIVQPFVPIAQLDYAVIERIFSVNWLGTLYMTKTFLPHLLARPDAHLVNVSSMGAFMPFPLQTAYGASKAAIKLLSEGLQGELAGTPVRVTVVFPGAIGTDILKNSGVEMPAGVGDAASKTTSPQRAAELIANAIEKNQVRVMVGYDAWALDLVSRIAPVRSASLIAKQLKKLITPKERS
jgi:short-subunit dehydrogenase